MKALGLAHVLLIVRISLHLIGSWINMLRVARTEQYVTVSMSGRVDAVLVGTLEEMVVSDLSDAVPGFKVCIDLTEASHITLDAAEALIRIQEMGRKAGLARSAVVTGNAAVRLQVERIARTSRIHSLERYIAAEKCPHWREVVYAWLVNGIEPAAYTVSVSHS